LPVVYFWKRIFKFEPKMLFWPSLSLSFSLSLSWDSKLILEHCRRDRVWRGNSFSVCMCGMGRDLYTPGSFLYISFLPCHIFLTPPQQIIIIASFKEEEVWFFYWSGRNWDGDYWVGVKNSRNFWIFFFSKRRVRCWTISMEAAHVIWSLPYHSQT
jgi:hypothetical protein